MDARKARRNVGIVDRLRAGLPNGRSRRYPKSMKRYTFKCIRAGGPGPAVHIDICADDAAARDRALRLFDLWPLAVKVEVSEDERHFEVLRP
ncbi:hypothetical protein [Sphingomonas sp. MMS24-J13]|uniref:hypothetical protein n=1 Tax=Sphingomonas sp. MMS24-J13 TaxID=3238686 RepID=UPI0038501A90